MTSLQKFDKCFGATGSKYGKVDRRPAPWPTSRCAASDRWNFLFIAGMWFQDLFNYDFRRTEQCIIPYATQEGEISFCAYNTGVGWRNIVEKMHMTATLTKWYEEHGRHKIFAGGKDVDLISKDHSLKLNAEARRRCRCKPTSTRPASPRPPAKRSSAPAPSSSSRTPSTPRWRSSTARRSSRKPSSQGFISLGEIKAAPAKSEDKDLVAGD